MFKEFNVEFQDVEMIGGADNLLENTKVTKVVMSGDNKMSSLDSAFKNCSELDNIQGGLDLNGVTDIDNILEGNSLIKNIDLKNINNENISVNNSFPNVEEINIGGELYNKKAIQNVIASKEWNFDNLNYTDSVGNNVFTKSVSVTNEDGVNIKDTLEQKAKNIEIKGQSYQNLINGSDDVDLLDRLVLESINGSPNEFAPHLETPVYLEVIEGETLQIEGISYGIGELQEDGTYKINILSHNNGSVPVKLIDNGKYSWDSGGLMPGEGFRSEEMYIDIDILKNKKIVLYSNSKIPNNYRYVIKCFDSNLMYTDKNYTILTMEYFTDEVLILSFEGDIPENATSFRWCCYNDVDNITKYNIRCYYVDKDFKDYLNIYEYIETIQSILLPQQLNKIGNLKDKLYWDNDKEHYCIEQNISEELEVMASFNIVDLPNLNKKYSLDTYMPTTYLECLNSPVQPSRLLLQSNITKYKANNLKANTKYTIQLDCKEKGPNPIKFSLGGTEKDVDVTLGLNHINITTLNELSDSDLVLSGQGNKISDVMLIEGDMKQYPNYFDGVQSVGVLQEDNTYKIDIKTNEDFIISIKTNLPLTKDDRLYWTDTNKRYEIDRNGEIEIPIVEGDIIDLPRLYQRDDTILTVDTGNIKPSEIKIKYKDLN